MYRCEHCTSRPQDHQYARVAYHAFMDLPVVQCAVCHMCHTCHSYAVVRTFLASGTYSGGGGVFRNPGLRLMHTEHSVHAHTPTTNCFLLDVYIYTYKRVVCVCWFVCLLFIGHTTFVHFAALPPSVRESRSRRGRPRARGQACTARARARMPYNFSTKKSYADAFQKQNCTRAHAVVYVTAEIFKKREKANHHATSQVQFTVCLLLECLLFESY